MTIRNFLPGFGMRTVAALAAVTAVVIAALLAVGSPVSAQSSDGDEIWSATITVEVYGTGSGAPRGFFNRGGGTDYGSLDDDTFTFDGTTYTIDIINDTAGFNGSQIFALSPAPSDDEAEAWTLHMSGRTYDLSDGNRC